MIKRKENNRKKSRLLIVGSFLLLFGFGIVCFKFYNNYSIKKQEENAIHDFFKIESKDDIEVISTDNVEEKQELSPKTNYNYIAVLEIPSIHLKRGLFPINDKNNNVNKNIEILQNSDMPDVQNGLLALAGHSGNSRIAFFNNLHKLKKQELVYVYYNNIKYIYEVTSIDRQDKIGEISITKTKDTTELVLTTCDPETKGKQVIVMAKLIEKQPY